MPVYKKDKFIERIYKGPERYRRVYKDGTLVYGLYDIKYYDRADQYFPDKKFNEIGIYAGGKKRGLPTVNTNNHFADYFDSYPTHGFGGYDAPIFEKEYKRLNDNSYNFYISKEEHKNFNLYSKGTQKQYQGSGVIQYGEASPEGGETSEGEYETLPERTERPRLENPGDSVFFSTGGEYAMPNCTAYVYCRGLEASGVPPVTSRPNAGRRGLEIANEPGQAYESNNGKDLRPGDIGIVAEKTIGDGHVFFVENDSYASQSGWTGPQPTYIKDGNNYIQAGYYDRGSDPVQAYNGIYNSAYGDISDRYVMNMAHTAHSLLNYRFWSRVEIDSSQTGGDPNFIGYLRGPGKGAPPGQSSVTTQTLEFDGTSDYINQENPIEPNPAEITGYDGAVGVDGPYFRTNTRNGEYPQMQELGGDGGDGREGTFDYGELGWDGDKENG